MGPADNELVRRLLAVCDDDRSADAVAAGEHRSVGRRRLAGHGGGDGERECREREARHDHRGTKHRAPVLHRRWALRSPARAVPASSALQTGSSPTRGRPRGLAFIWLGDERWCETAPTVARARPCGRRGSGWAPAKRRRQREMLPRWPSVESRSTPSTRDRGYGRVLTGASRATAAGVPRPVGAARTTSPPSPVGWCRATAPGARAAAAAALFARRAIR